MSVTIPATDSIKEIDKIAFIYIKERKLLSSRSRSNSTWYIPGGKREPGENDVEALLREVKEELSIDIVTSDIRYIGTFKAQAANHKQGIIVKMSCYTSTYTGDLAPSSEIEEIDFITLEDKDKSSPVDRLILQSLYDQNLID